MQTLVLKIGSSTLTEGTDRISRGKIEDIAAQLQVLQKEYRIILVTSGAIAAARQFSSLEGKPTVMLKQALAAIGQLQLMRIFQEIFRDYDLKIAQSLLTYYDFKNQESRQNTYNTLSTLLQHGYIPVINENDTVATDEIKFGDNDKLAALTSELIGADLLVLATDTNGLYNDDPKTNPNAYIIEKINNIEDVENFIAETKSKLGSGGMRSKIEAARIAQNAGIECWILNGGVPYFLQKALTNQSKFTRILKPMM